VTDETTIAAPKRRFELAITITGDTWEDVLFDLRDIAPHIETHGPGCTSVSGAPSHGHIVQVTERPEQTHEKYIEDLDRYLATIRKEPR
jgi:hypothetical protein